MAQTVFLSGSRKISRLNDRLRGRIDNILRKRLHVIVGDANGADKAVQAYLADKSYPAVTVYCANGRCRNNLGSWEERRVPVPAGASGRDFYTQKDVAMAEDADYGLVLWDGKSPGSIKNVFELAKRGKTVVVYLSQKQTFLTIRNPTEIRTLLEQCEPIDREQIDSKTGLSRKLQKLTRGQQPAFELS